MTKIFTQIYSNFWSTMFGLTAHELESIKFQATTKGYYLERHQDKYIFLYQNLTTGNLVLAATADVSKSLLTEKNLDSGSTTPETIQSILAARKLAYKDIDYGLNSLADFQPTQTTLKIAEPVKDEIEAFLKLCNDDDIDTLDLTFEKEIIQGLYAQDNLVGISRFTEIRETGLADITVLVAPSYRGRGYSTPLVSKILDLILVAGLTPKYRVDKDNFASQAIAEKLGLKKMSSLTVWENEDILSLTSKKDPH